MQGARFQLSAVKREKMFGYQAVEGVPIIRTERYEWDNLGPIRVYERAGFVKSAEQDGVAVMRKEPK